MVWFLFPLLQIAINLRQRKYKNVVWTIHEPAPNCMHLPPWVSHNILFGTKSIVVAILGERSVSFWHDCSLARQDFLSTTTFVKDLQPLAIPLTIALFLMSSQGAYSIKYWIKAAWFSQRTDSPYRSLPPDVWHVASCWVWQKVS